MCYYDLAVMISLVGEDLLQVREFNLTLTMRLEWSGLSFGVIPLTVLPVSYADFDLERARFGVSSTLNQLYEGGDIPVASALACE